MEMDQKTENSESDLDRQRILIVDDEETALKRMRSLMEKQGYAVHVASSGEQALELLDSRSFDLVLTDLIMDSIDGLAVLAHAKKISPET
jgi:CheY-like chemotaxis protein